MKENKKFLLIAYVTFGFIGFILSMRTNIFYYVNNDYYHDFNSIGRLVLISGLFMQLSLYFTGHLIKKLGYKKMLLGSIIGNIFPLIFMLFVNSALSFNIVYTFYMIAYGIIIIVLNMIVGVLAPTRRANVLMSLHLSFSIGSLIGPLYISKLTELNINWQSIIASSSIVLILISIFVYRSNKTISEIEVLESSNKSEFNLRNPLVWFFVIAFLCSQVWEYGVGTWFTIFASDTKHLSAVESAVYLTIFYASYPLVRIVSARIIHKFNILKVLFFAFSWCTLLIALGITTKNLIFYSLTGSGVALMYPGLMAAMQETFGAKETSNIAFITMIGGLIQYVAIWSVGLISNSFGMQVGFTSMIIYLFIGAISILAILIFKKQASLNYERCK